MTGKKQRKQVDIIVPRRTNNDCFGYCIPCPQGKMTLRQTEDADVYYYTCELPQCHNVTLARIRRKK